MAKIIKVSPTLTPSRVANPFKNSGHTTNPFKYSNFEGNTLQFADVFEGFEPKNVSKLKMIASSVAGSMHKMRSGIIEPIAAFANRVRTGVTSAWNYATSTNVSELPVLRDVATNVNAWTENVACRMAEVGKSINSVKSGITSKTGVLNTDITDIGKMVSERWTEMIAKYSKSRITAATPVAELEQLWKAEMEGAVA